MPAKVKGGLSHHIGLSKSLIHSARVQSAGKAKVVPQFRMDHRRLRQEGGVHVQGGRQVFPFNLNVLQGIFSLRSGFSHYCHYGFALPRSFVQSHRVLGRRFDTCQVRERTYPRLTHLRHVMAIQYSQHTGHGSRGLTFNFDNAGMCHWRAPVHNVCHTWQLHVINKLPASLGQSFNVGSGYRLANMVCVF